MRLSQSSFPGKVSAPRKGLGRMRCLFLLALFFLASCAKQEAGETVLQTYTEEHPYQPVVRELPEVPAGRVPDNIILLIGDGMSLHHVGAAWVANRGCLNIDAFPYTGLSRTYCSDRLITDSGAGGTALATGRKTAYHHVGTDADGNALPSLITYAQEAGMRTGISVVCRLCDATPADFCCHSADRDLYDTINAGYLYCKADFIAGGGMHFFQNRADGRKIFDEMGEKGYHLASSPEELFAASELPVCALLADSEYVVAPDRGDLFPHQTMHAISLLSCGQPFFLMVEGSCIDDWSHANNLERVIEETLDFDRTVGEVLRWAAQDGRTLVVVTSDHETGAFTLQGGDIREGRVEAHFANESHSGVLVPIYAYGPGAERFTGIMENAELAQKLIGMIK